MNEEHERLIWEYCGLTEGQFLDLQDAFHVRLRTMNGARRHVLRELIDHTFHITELGIKVYQRALWVCGPGFDLSPDTLAAFKVRDDTARAARLVNRQFKDRVNGLKVTSAHMKVLAALGMQPGLSENWLTSVYGWRTAHDLIDAGLTYSNGFDQSVVWRWYALQVTAMHLLDDLAECM